MTTLVQGRVSSAVAKKLDALARAVGCSRATYVARLVATHVRTLSPRAIRAALQEPKIFSPDDGEPASRRTR